MNKESHRTLCFVLLDQSFHKSLSFDLPLNLLTKNVHNAPTNTITMLKKIEYKIGSKASSKFFVVTKMKANTIVELIYKEIIGYSMIFDNRESKSLENINQI